MPSITMDLPKGKDRLVGSSDIYQKTIRRTTYLPGFRAVAKDMNILDSVFPILPGRKEDKSTSTTTTDNASNGNNNGNDNNKSGFNIATFIGSVISAIQKPFNDKSFQDGINCFMSELKTHGTFLSRTTAVMGQMAVIAGCWLWVPITVVVLIIMTVLYWKRVISGSEFGLILLLMLLLVVFSMVGLGICFTSKAGRLVNSIEEDLLSWVHQVGPHIKDAAEKGLACYLGRERE